MKVILSLGSNIGDKMSYLNQAVNLIKSNNLLHNIIISNIYETEPVGFSEQDWFLNMALMGETLNEGTTTSAEKLFTEIKSIEQQIGRVHRQRWHEREIDIDIIFFGSQVINSDNLTIPHPRMHLRNFVLAPCSEIANDFIHPTLNKTISELYKNSKDKAEVKLLAKVKIDL